MTSMECGLPPTPIDRVLSQEKLDKLGFLISVYSVLIGMHFIALDILHVMHDFAK